MPCDYLNHRLRTGYYDLTNQARADNTSLSGNKYPLDTPRQVTPPPESYTFWNNLCHSLRLYEISHCIHQNPTKIKSKHCLLAKVFVSICLPILTLITYDNPRQYDSWTTHDNQRQYHHDTRPGQILNQKPDSSLGCRPTPCRHLDTYLSSWTTKNAPTMTHTWTEHDNIRQLDCCAKSVQAGNQQSEGSLGCRPNPCRHLDTYLGCWPRLNHPFTTSIMTTNEHHGPIYSDSPCDSLGSRLNPSLFLDTPLDSHKPRLNLLLSGDIESNPGPVETPPNSGLDNQNTNSIKNPNVLISHNLNILTLNAQSIKGTDLDKTKLIDFRHLVDVMDPDIMTVTETWLKDMVTDLEITDLNKYALHRKDREDIRGGSHKPCKKEYMVNPTQGLRKPR